MNVTELWERHRLDILTSLSLLWGFAWGYIVKTEMVRIDRLAGFRLTTKRRKPGMREGRVNTHPRARNVLDFTIPLTRRKKKGK